MKKITISILFLSLTIPSFSQTVINNADFTNWTAVGQATEEPQYWNSNKTGGGNAGSAFAPQTCYRESNNPHSAPYCAKVVSGSAVGIVVNGSLTTGKVEAPSTNKSEGYIRTIANDANYGMPFTGRPDSLIFWFRYTSVSNDYPRVEARLHVGNAYSPEAPVNGNHPDSTMNIIARAQWTGATASVANWTRVSIPFVYVDSRTPQYILITTTSSGDQTGGSANSTMWLDDFEAFYLPAVYVNTITPTTYYVSATSGSTINIPYTLQGAFTAGNTITAQLSDASGSFTNPVTIGTATSTTSGILAATIPAATANGTGYRVRLVTSTPSLTSTANSANLTIINVTNSIAPTATQNILSNANGTALTVTESNGSTSRIWKYANISGGPYTAITPAQTGISYTPNFQAGGTYFVICETNYPGGLNVKSNEVQIDVIGNNITPAAPQSITVNTNGNILTVNETAPATSREWKFTTTQGTNYLPFTPAQTGLTYTPNFSSNGTFFIVCESVINGTTVRSNEVEVTVGTPVLTTGTIAGSPFEFSISAPNAAVLVPYNTTTAVFDYNTNIFTAQLSDASGSFTNATNIGTLQSGNPGTINAVIPSNTPSGTAYRIRVISSVPVVYGSNNGIDLIIDQFSNSIAPTSSQSILYNTNGTPIIVSASQNATHEWKYSSTSGSGYQSFSPAQTGSSYTPNFALPGTYYVVAVSKNQYNDEVTSTEVTVEVLNGSTITTQTVNGSPYLVSPSANVQISVPFTSDAVFNSGNVFSAELSDPSGAFTNPLVIGTLSGNTVSAISATIPNSSVYGTGYRIRVTSTDPAIIGSDNGADRTIIPFEISVSPSDTQNLVVNTPGTTVTVTESHPSTRQWLYSDIPGIAYQAFSPAQTLATLTPQFTTPGVYYVICKSTNAVNDNINSQEIVMIVSTDIGIGKDLMQAVKLYWNADNLVVDLSAAKLEQVSIELHTLDGKLVLTKDLVSNTVNSIPTQLPAGLYLFQFSSNSSRAVGKLMKR